MKYDLKRLKGALDEQIRPIQPDENLLDRAMKQSRKPAARYPARALTAAAACLLILACAGALFGRLPGSAPKPGGQEIASQGGMPAGQEGEVSAGAEEDLSVYRDYRPMYASSALPDEAAFGEVVIRRLDDADRLFVFLDGESGEEVIPGRFWQAFAYFPLTETGLVQPGNGEGLRLVDAERMYIGDAYSHFDYVGGGVAVVAGFDGDESDSDSMYLISTADGARLSRDYEIIGTMRSGEDRLLMGHDTQDLTGEFDVMDLTGRVIVRAEELGGLYFGKWLSVRLPGENWYCLVDMNGELQMDGQKFGRVAMEKDGCLVTVTDEGWGVIGSDGNWIFEPGRYLMIEILSHDLFRAADPETGEMIQINAQGEPVDSFRFRWDRLMNAAGDAFGAWKERMGMPGFAVVCLLAWWLLLRLGVAHRRGELAHMLMAEAGFAVYITALLLISHRNGTDYAVIWPTDTSTEGANQTAFGWMLASYALLASLAACYPRLRRPKAAFLAGMAAMVLPWAWKAVCSDMTVAGWQTMSAVVFGGGALLAALLWLAKPVRRFMDWCARFDALNDYARWVRMIWWAAVSAALINFGAGCWISGQELISVTTHADVQRGVMGSLGNAWIEDVNRLLEEYPEDEFASRVADGLSQREYTAVAAARYLHENSVSRLTDDMVLRVKVTGTAKTRRPARVQMVIDTETDAACQISAEYGLTLPDGTMESSADFILLPGQPAPDIRVWLSVSQPADRNPGFAAQRWYRADLGGISVPDLAPADSPY